MPDLIGQPNKIVVATTSVTILSGERGIVTGVLLVSDKTNDVNLLLQEADASGAELCHLLMPGTEDSRYFPVHFTFTNGLYHVLAGTLSYAYLYIRQGM